MKTSVTKHILKINELLSHEVRKCKLVIPNNKQEKMVEVTGEFCVNKLHEIDNEERGRLTKTEILFLLMHSPSLIS